jgi:uncharacterized repeat protein (TIGR01451 family)
MVGLRFVVGVMLATLLLILPGLGDRRQPTVTLALGDDDVRTAAAIETSTLGSASFHVATVSIPTYPYAEHLASAYTSAYNMTYDKLDWDTYDQSNPTPAPRGYELLVLENDYLRVTLLPELGGRIYQMIFKPTGHNELYQNPVIKPTHWGPSEQGWWLAAGGIEWCLPVDEHGYEWGEPWSYEAVTSTAGVTVTLRDTTAADRIRAVLTVHLPSQRAYLAVTPRIENPTGSTIHYKYWTNAMLAPGEDNTVAGDLRFIFNAGEVSIHSTGDSRLPGHAPTQPTGPDYRISWPLYNGIDFSRLDNWDRWLGFFEYPYASVDFAGAYDTAADEGVARVFPSGVVPGSKGFGFGWSNPNDPDGWTDDGSTYVELHGGVVPTFWDEAIILAGQSHGWTEYWYPVSDIGQLSAATEEAALGVREGTGIFTVGLQTTAPRAAGTGTLHAWDRSDCSELARWELPAIQPDKPFTTSLATGGRALDEVAFVYLDADQDLLAAANFRDCLPPASAVESLPQWVGTTGFTVIWAGQDSWSAIDTYDVQVRDGYEGTWGDWLNETPGTSGTFTGTHGHTYFFRARARDSAGNKEPFADAEWGQAFTTVLTEPAPVLVTSRKSAIPFRFHPNQPIQYSVVISNTGNLTAAATLTDTPPTAAAVLVETLASTSGPEPIYTDGQIHWSGTVGAGAEARVTYKLMPTTILPPDVPVVNAAEIAGSLLGPFTRRATVMQAHLVWLPLVTRGFGP